MFFSLHHAKIWRRNYEFWKVKMKDFLLLEDLWRIVDKGFEKVENKFQLSYAIRNKYMKLIT